MLRAVAVWALVIAAIASKPPAPTPAEAGQRAEQGANQSGSNPSEKSNGASPFLGSHATGGETACPCAKAEPNNGGPAAQWWFNFLLVILTGALAVLGLLQWRTFRWQAKVMQRQAAVMRRQLAEMKTTNADTHDLAVAAQDAALAAHQQTKVMREQLSIMAEQGEAMLTQTRVLMMSAEAAAKGAEAANNAVSLTRLLERPWVKVSLRARTHLRFEDTGPWITFWLELKNVGTTIAQDVRYGCELLCVPPGLDGPLDMSRSDPPCSAGAQVLFPGEASEQVVHVSIDAAALDPQLIFDGAAVLQISGVIRYRSPTTDSTRRHTRFLYQVGRYDHARASISVRRGETVTPDDIKFLKLPNGSYAD